MIRVPLKRLTAESASGIGQVIRHLDEARPALRRGRMVVERIEVTRRGDRLHFQNHAVGDSGPVATLVDGCARVSHVNFHSDASQAFISRRREATVFLVAPPAERARAEDFVALYSDGSLGLCMLPDVWHTTPLPVTGSQEYDNTQGDQYHSSTVDHDFAQDDVVLEVPLREPEPA
ncbi:MAG TPA: ureidoglycolate lyase [Actinomycetota bacterium]|nr:ureidoglycolate lyase [Actinomycetota bacterium]